MARLNCEDAYCLGLLYAYLYANKKMVLKEDLDSFHELIEITLKKMNEDKEDLSTPLWYDDEPSIYFAAEGKNGEIYYVLHPNFDLTRAKSKYIGTLPIEILMASQNERVLNAIDLKIVNGQIVKRKPNELRIPKTDVLKDAKRVKISFSENHKALVKEADERIEEGRRRERDAWISARDYVATSKEEGPVKRLTPNNKTN